MENQIPSASTFTVVARDPATRQLGIATASRLVAVGAYVPYAQAEIGAVASQARMNLTYGPRAVKWLAEGVDPDAILDSLLASDDQAEQRQVAIVSADGRAAFRTTAACDGWAGGMAEENLCCLGNTLTGPHVITAMMAAYRSAREDDFGGRLMAALVAGEQAGGDSRGNRAAALLVVREGWGYRGFNDRYRDIRVDDHPNPTEELERLYRLHCERFTLIGPWDEFGHIRV